MAITDALLPEFDYEMATTRRLLDRVPEARFSWKPHEKSMTLGQLAGHLANIPDWCSATLNVAVLDSSKRWRRGAPEGTGVARGAARRVRPQGCSRARAARADDRPWSPAPWTLKKGEQEFFTMPAHCGHPQLRDESHNPSSRATERVFALERRADPADLRPDGG